MRPWSEHGSDLRDRSPAARRQPDPSPSSGLSGSKLKRNSSEISGLSSMTSIFSNSNSSRDLTTMQSFLVITSSVCGQIACGSIFILNFYIPYFVSYVRIRGSDLHMNMQDGKLILLLLATSYGMSGIPLGIIVSRIPIHTSLTLGTAVFMLGYCMLFLGIEYEYAFVISGVACLGISAMMMSISILLRSLRNFREHWGVVSGTLLGAAFGATSIFHIWERSVVNPLNIQPVNLDDSGSEFWYYQNEYVLDRCSDFFWIMAVVDFFLLMFPMVVFRVVPAPPPLEEEYISFIAACRETTSRIITDVRFILAFVAFAFGGVAGLCARSSLKTYGESFIQDEHYLSSVGSSGSLAAAVGAITMGIIHDMTQVTPAENVSSPKLLLFNVLLNFIGSVMMMFAPSIGKVWFLFCYDFILFGFGGFSTVLAMVLLEIFTISKFPIAFGIISLSTFFSSLWYTFAVLYDLPWKDLWMANAFFAFMAVIGAIALIVQYQMRRREEEPLVLMSDEEEETEYIFRDGKKYVLQE